MTAEPRQTRSRWEHALVRVAHHYGGRSEFVLLGGLVADLLCSTSGLSHAGTTDVDVQLDLEIAGGGVNARRLERALHNSSSSVTRSEPALASMLAIPAPRRRARCRCAR